MLYKSQVFNLQPLKTFYLPVSFQVTAIEFQETEDEQEQQAEKAELLRVSLKSAPVCLEMARMQINMLTESVSHRRPVSEGRLCRNSVCLSVLNLNSGKLHPRSH